MVKAEIRMVLLLVFMGIIMIFVMMPTTTFKKVWFPSIKAKTQSKYFGSAGARLLIYTFPMLFIAALGCVYLHLTKNNEDNYKKSDKEKNRISIWKTPVLVKGPLGIVTGTELAFFIMFIALLVWSFASYLVMSFETINKKTAAKSGLTVWQDKLESAGLRFGLVGNIALSFLFFPVARGSSMLPLLGLTSEASIKYHIWLGHIAMVLFTAHGLCYTIVWANTGHLVAFISWRKADISVVAGEVALICGLAMWVTVIPRIRRKMFEVFFYTHHLYIGFVAFFVFHVGFAYTCIMLPGFYLFLVDRYLRFLQSRRQIRLLSSRVLPCDTVELNFLKDPALRYTTTSIVFVNIPSISKIQWHPFTITSNSNLEPEKLSLMIKKEGSWSQKLHQILSTASSVDHLNVCIEGPYGPASTHFLRHDTLVMVCGGSGITPFISIIREIIFRSTTSNSKTTRVLLVCAFKHSTDLTMLDLILPISGTTDISRVQLQIEAYVTREKQPNVENKNQVRSIWFKSNATDMPITATLGPNSWLWLGAIISSSFVIFLILLGVLTRFYIYPIDHNTNEIYPWAYKSLFCMFFICASIVITSTAVVLWNKNQNGKGLKQIQNTDTNTPMNSPGSLFHNGGDTELESLPSQSLVQATNIHFGARPDLKTILFDCEGSSVGVLVCGPKKMRHEVATICTAGLVDNLHFESISFSW